MLQEFITAGTVPDIIYASPGDLFGLMDMQVLEDMTPLIKKHNFDLGRYNPDVLRGIRQYFAEDQLPVLPDNVQGAVLTYNKTIFDKFGVSYPKDGMTWTEAIELARKVTRNEGGVQYRGLDFAVGYLINNNQLSLSFIDSRKGKAAVSNDGWKHWFNMMRSIYEIEGNQVTKDQFDKADSFLKDQILAMYAAPSGMLNRISDAEKAGLKWDLATLPYFPDAPETGMQLNTTFYFVPPTSKYKDQAFDVIAELLSDEVQSANARNGRMTVLNKQEIKNEFGKDLPYLQGKNVAAIFKQKIARPAAITDNDKLVKGPLKNQFFEVISGSKDVNTALRETEEEADKAIQAKKSQ
jgi:multiple sugar transport system substrate-binding protein